MLENSAYGQLSALSYVCDSEVTWVYGYTMSPCKYHESQYTVVKPIIDLFFRVPPMFQLFSPYVSEINYTESLRNIWRRFHGEPALKKGYKT